MFSHEYEVCRIDEIPSGTRTVFFPGASDYGADGVIVKVSPIDGTAWVGIFEFGYQSPQAISTVAFSPNRFRCCVISSGAAYIVDSRDPHKWEKLPVFPVVDFYQAYSDNLLLFADFTKVVAYGTGGVAWTSPRLSSDGLRITDVKDGLANVQGEDAATRAKTTTVVSLSNGQIVGL